MSNCQGTEVLHRKVSGQGTSKHCIQVYRSVYTGKLADKEPACIQVYRSVHDPGTAWRVADKELRSYRGTTKKNGQVCAGSEIDRCALYRGQIVHQSTKESDLPLLHKISLLPQVGLF